ncbi:putative disease resistance protein RGA1 [Amaranthus tricolor]|uniref:putative disease resistance protein RGA1 n=1 Tax=Amaranthus tricolor TaxID=29722 RepID=UPI00258C4F5A|nr:putative disease resistance protein RGA1 [Amaranthus tricolor]
MEVAGTALSAIQTILSALQSPHLKKIISIYGYESKLDELQSTVNSINNLLRKAQSVQELPDDIQGWIEDLKDVVFEAEDLLDEFVTLAEQNKHLKADGTISKKMKRFLSRSNPFLVAFKMSKGVDKIRKKLEAIAHNKQFIMEFNHEPIKYRKPETCSYVDVAEIIGREGDLEHIVGRLLDSDVQTDVSFLSIVGMGGLGKTALAQLVYSDKRVESAFNLRLWHCVSDQDHKQLNITGILGAILALCPNEKFTDQSSLQIVQSQLQKKLSDKKYLLVLDDVWTENRNQWIELVSLLKVGQKGSWIVVTTRSQVTANFMGYDSMYQLQGLKKEDSWSLFEKVAFGSEQWNHHDDLVEIGQKIVEACGGVPLAIRVAGSLVYGQDKKKWEAVQEVGVANMGNNDITQILKLSYHHLPFSLKNCFSFCAIFPKDYRMKKNTLINLWIAHNYIVPSHKGQSIEDAGEEHFLILLRRCFFQDIEKDVVTGEVDSIKIHDLLHDIAQDVSRKEIFAGSDNLHKNIRHLSLFKEEINYEISSLDIPRLRSYLDYRYFSFRHEDNFLGEKLIKSCRNLRALRLKIKDLSSLNYVGELFHLRYLDLSSNTTLEVLPKSITKLCNLEVLMLYGCGNLKELPEDLSRLIKLRVLDISGCFMLKYMPKGMDKLTCLYRLSDFIVGGKDCYSSWSEWFLGLEELKDLKNLHGPLRIKIKLPENISQDQIWERKRFYLRDKKHLNHICIDFYFDKKHLKCKSRVLDNEGAIKLMEDLHPPSSLRFFEMYNYVGKQMPEWISHLPNLYFLQLNSCYNLEYLECFGNVDERSILPSLQKLRLKNLPKLKGWRIGGVGVEDNNNSLCLPSLKKLYIKHCEELTCFPACPGLEEFFLSDFNTRLNGIMRRTERDDEESREVIVLKSSKLRKVKINDVACLNSLPIQALQRLETLTIFWDEKEENLGELFRACSSSLRILEIKYCLNLRSIVAGELEHLSALETLSISSCFNLKFSEEKEENDGVGYNPSILPSLLTLSLNELRKMEHLPNWMQFLPALQTLEINSCCKLKAIPNWMPKLTSLKKLYVFDCLKSLERRCKEDPPGEDWPYIQHIPNIQFINCFKENSDEEYSDDEYLDEDYCELYQNSGLVKKELYCWNGAS